MKKFMLVALGVTLLAGCTPTPVKEQAKAGAVSKAVEEVITSVASAIVGKSKEEADTEVSQEVSEAENPTLSDAAKHAVEESIKAIQEGGEILAADVIVADEQFNEIPVNPENGLAANQLRVSGKVLTAPMSFEEAHSILSDWNVHGDHLIRSHEYVNMEPTFYTRTETYTAGFYDSVTWIGIKSYTPWDWRSEEWDVPVEGFHPVTLGAPITVGVGEAEGALQTPGVPGNLGHDDAIYWPIMQLEDGSWLLDVVYVIQGSSYGRGVHIVKCKEGVTPIWCYE